MGHKERNRKQVPKSSGPANGSRSSKDPRNLPSPPAAIQAGSNDSKNPSAPIAAIRAGSIDSTNVSSPVAKILADYAQATVLLQSCKHTEALRLMVELGRRYGSYALYHCRNTAFNISFCKHLLHINEDGDYKVEFRLAASVSAKKAILLYLGFLQSWYRWRIKVRPGFLGRWR